MMLRGIAVALVALATAGPAHAAELRSPPESTITEGPTLVGSSVSWEDAVCVDGCDPQDIDCNATYRKTLRVATGGRRPAQFLRRLQGCGGIASHALISPTYLALQNSYSAGGTDGDDQSEVDLSAGARGGRAHRIYRCYDGSLPEGQYVDPEAKVALAGSLLAWKQACPGLSRIIVRDLATGRERQVVPPGQEIKEFALAGRWLARTTATGVDLYDAVTGVLRSHVPNPYSRDSISGVRVRADGTVAFGSYECAARAMVMRPGSTVAQPLPIAACSRVIPTPGGFVYRTGRSAHDIRFLDARTGAARTVVHSARFAADGEFDAVGGRVAFATPTCDGAARFSVVRIASSTRTHAPRCSIEGRGASVDRRSGRLVVRFVCPRGCTGFVRVRAGHKVTAYPSFERSPSGRVRTLPILVGRKTRLALRRGLDPSRLYVSATTYDSFRIRHSTRLSRARPVRRLPGGRSPFAYLYASPAISTQKRPRAQPMCEVGERYRDEHTGLPLLFTYSDEDDFVPCLRRRPAVRGGSFTVRTPREARRIRVRVGRAPSSGCGRVRPGQWRCAASLRRVGRNPRLRLTVTYPWSASTTWAARFAR